MGKKGGKDAAKKEAKKARQEAKHAKSSKKRASKEAGGEDIEAILADILKKEAAKTAVTVSIADVPPTPRANFSFTSLPSGDLIVFGGEFYDGANNTCYNDLYRWNPERNEWRHIESPNTPPPRCSHQAVYYRGSIYIYGGEFATTEQFHHYKDFWRLDVKANTWHSIDLKGSAPTARSGHRMGVFRNYLVLFGGFYEAFRDTRWFGDLYVLNFQDLKWQKIEFGINSPQPSPRSGHLMAVHEAKSQVFVYGGFSKVKESGAKSEAKVHNDMWVLDLKPLAGGKGKPVWERMGKKGAPPCQRSSAAMVVHKNRALLFGGVVDQEGPQHSMVSTFYNDLHAFDMDRKHWYRLQLKSSSRGGRRRKKKPAEEEESQEPGQEEENETQDYIDSDDEQEMADAANSNAFVYINGQGKLVYVHDECEGEEGGARPRTSGKLYRHGKTALTSPAPTHLTPSLCVAGPPIAAHSPACLLHPASLGGQSEPEPEPALGESALPKSLEPEVAPPEPPSTSHETANGEGNEQAGEAAPAHEAAQKCPLPRIKAALAVRGNTLFIYGGLLEVKDREYTLDDCWALDLNTRTEWKTIQEGSMDQQAWLDTEEDGSEFGEGDGDEPDTDDSDNDDNEEDEHKATSCLLEVKSLRAAVLSFTHVLGGERKSSGKGSGFKDIRHEIRSLQAQFAVDDVNRMPLSGESLRDYFARTGEYWLEQLIEKIKAK
ncbi:unnamed protein product [Chrysoparadoxa australica]